MPLTLYVDRRAWQAHHRRVVAERPGLVPVVKGNGYGFTVPVLAEAAAALGPQAGVDLLAVGTAEEAVRVLEHFPHDLVLLEPFLPGAPWVELPDRVVRNAASVEAVRALAGRRMVIDCRSSLRRQGVARTELDQVREALGNARPEGFALHLPIDRPGRVEPVREIADWVRALTDAELDVPLMYVSHVSGAELARLGGLFPRTRFRVRCGSDIWLGDPSAIEARATVLDALPVARGERVGYRQGRLRHGGWVIVVSGGTVQGVGLEAPRQLRGLQPRAKELVRCGLRAMNRTLSPFSWQGRRQWFAEPPHMSVSMIYLPGAAEPPAPGSELVAELRHTATHFDRVAIS
jgi:hypothetical protein